MKTRNLISIGFVALALFGGRSAVRAAPLAYVYGDGVLQKVDIGSATVTQCPPGSASEVPSPAIGLAVNYAGNRFYAPILTLTTTFDYVLREYDQNCNTLREVSLPSPGFSVRGVAVSKDDKRVFAVDSGNNLIYVVRVDGPTMVVTSTASVNEVAQPACALFGVAADPSNTGIAWVSSDNCDVARVIIDGADHVSSVAFVNVNPDPNIQGSKFCRGLAVHPSGKRVYCAKYVADGPDLVKIIDAQSFVVIDSTQMVQKAWAVAVNPAGTELYVPVVNSADEARMCWTQLNANGDRVNIYFEVGPLTGFGSSGRSPRGVSVNSNSQTVYAVYGGNASRIGLFDVASHSWIGLMAGTLGTDPHAGGLFVKPCFGGCCN